MARRRITAQALGGRPDEFGLHIDAGVRRPGQQTPIQQPLHHDADAAAHFQDPEGGGVRPVPHRPHQVIPDVPVQGAVIQALFGGQIADKVGSSRGGHGHLSKLWRKVRPRAALSLQVGWAAAERCAARLKRFRSSRSSISRLIQRARAAASPGSTRKPFRP